MGNKGKYKRKSSDKFSKFILEARTRLQQRKLDNFDFDSDSSICENMASVDNILSVLPSFDGKKENNIKLFIQLFQEAADQTKLSEPVKLIILKSKITGTARERMQADTEIISETNYENLKKKLLEIFGTKITFNDAHELFAKLKQNPDEKMNDFILRFNLNASKFLETSGFANKPDAKNMFELMKLNKFINAIRSDIALEVRKRAVTKFSEAVEIARNIETAFNATNFEEINSIAASSKDELCNSLLKANQIQNEKYEQLKRDFEELKLKAGNVKSNNDIENKKHCDICNLSNHYTNQCRRARTHRNAYKWPNATYNYPQMQNCQWGPTSMVEGTNSPQGFGTLASWSPTVPPPARPRYQNAQGAYPNSFQPQSFQTSNFAFPAHTNYTPMPYSNPPFTSFNQANIANGQQDQNQQNYSYKKDQNKKAGGKNNKFHSSGNGKGDL